MEPTAVASFVDSKIRESQAGLLTQLDTLITNKLGAFQQRISDTQRDLSEAQIAKIEDMSKDQYKFRKRGNEEQYKVNVKVTRKLKEADAILKDDDITGKAEAQLKISEGIQILEHRQKLIKIADSSDGGWNTVDEYEKNSLAADSDDEKRLIRAESRAQRKKKSRDLGRKKPFVSRFTPYKSAYVGRGSSISTSFGPPLQSQEPPRATRLFAGRKPGSCFACGKAGHWRAECREMGGDASQNAKLSENYLTLNLTNRASEAIKKALFVGTSKCADTMSSPVGRLRENLESWANINANEVVMDVIEHGYKLPFYSDPERVDLTNNRSALDKSKFVEEEISRLLEKGCVSQVNENPLIINPLTVSDNKDLGIQERIQGEIEAAGIKSDKFSELSRIMAQQMLDAKSESTTKRYRSGF
nr:uncharacterized protein LOC129255079 [Lytechinus pictus]